MRQITATCLFLLVLLSGCTSPSAFHKTDMSRRDKDYYDCRTLTALFWPVVTLDGCMASKGYSKK
jgi:hypothetical protein